MFGFFKSAGSSPTLPEQKDVHECEYKARQELITKEVEQSFDILQSMVAETTNIAHDVSTKLESRFAATQRKLLAVLDGVTDGIVIVDMDGKIHEWNRGAELITGLRRDQVMCESFYDLEMLEVIEETTRKGVDVRYVNKQGEYLVLNIMCSQFNDVVDGNPGMVLVIRDHTVTRLERAQIERERDAIREVLDAVGDAVIVKDENLEWVHLNSAARQLLTEAVGEEALYGAPQEIFELLRDSGSLQTRWAEMDAKSIREGIKIVSDETAGDGEKIFEVQRTPFTMSTNDKMVINVVKDVTERRQRQVQNKTVMRALDESSDAVVVIDRKGKIVYYNTKMRSMYPGVAIGQNYAKFISKPSRRMMRNIIDRVVAGEVWKGFIACIVEGNSRMMYTNVVPVAGLEGDVDRYIVFQNDVGEFRL